MQRISSSIYVEDSFNGCNTSFIKTKQGVVIIDTPMVPVEAKKWGSIIAEFGEIRYIINTEPHPDHVSGNYWFDGIIVSHEGSRQFIQNIQTEELVNLLSDTAPESLPLDIDFKFRLPEITFSQNLTIFLGSHTFQLINLPGHTPYQLAVYVPEEKVVFTSDNVSREMPIFNELSMPSIWLDSLKSLQNMDVEKVVPGHGDVCGKNCLLEMYDIVQFWIDSVKSAVIKGWSLEATLEKVTLSDMHPEQEMNERMRAMKRRSMANLYEILKRGEG